MVDNKIQEDVREPAAPHRASIMTVQAEAKMHSGIDTLYRRYRTQARRAASRYYPFDAATAEDVVQDVFVSLCEAIDRIDTSRPMAGWIGRVTSNHCQDRRRREVVSQEVLRANTLEGMTSELTSRIEERDDLSHVLGALERLPAQQAYAFQRHYLQGIDQKTIADQLGVTNGYVSKLLKMARSTLLQEINGSTPKPGTEGIGKFAGVPADQKSRQNMNKKTNGESDKAGIGGIFRGLGNVVELLSNLADKANALEDQIQREGQAGNDRGVKAVYGYSLRVGGAGGKPVVQHFGNVKDGDHGATVDQQREPMIDVFDEGDHIQLVAELPGVDESDIRFALRHDVLELSAQRGDRRYYKEILLPSAVSLTGSKASYNNGVFELTLPKNPEAGPTGAE